MNQEYSLSGDIVSVGGIDSLNEIVRRTVGGHYYISLALIIVLALIVFYLLYTREHFNPTQTLRAQKVSLSGTEAMTDVNGNPLSPDVQQIWDDNSCATDVPVGDDAWGWLYNQLQTGGSTAVINPYAPPSSAQPSSGASTSQSENFKSTKSGKLMMALNGY